MSAKGRPGFTFSLPGERFAPLPPVSHATACNKGSTISSECLDSHKARFLCILTVVIQRRSIAETVSVPQNAFKTLSANQI